MTPITIGITMDDNDFEQVIHNGAEWSRTWADKTETCWRAWWDRGRFENCTYETSVKPSSRWAWAYWVETWPSVMLIRAYLRGRQHGCEVLYDLATDPLSYVILTDYVPVRWAEAAKA